jgi:dolichyl-phosphate-mannose--protein O-mannosyl transferase
MTAARAEADVTRSTWARADTICLIVIVVIAALLRLWTLSHPNELIFDETYYARDACWYVNHSESVCERAADAPEVHPPLGKWLIAIGIRFDAFDCPEETVCEGSESSFGWRIMPAIAGIATVALLYLLARRLLRSTVAATIAASLLALDFLHLVQSRTSMLDIFIPLFGIAGFLFLAFDRDQVGTGARWFDRPWRLAAGAAFGAAAATKWSGALYLVAGMIISLAWEWSAARRSKTSLRDLVTRQLPSLALYMVAVPIIVYVFTYLGRLEGSFLGLPWSEGHWLRALWDHHQYMLDFHKDLASNHSYQSPPWSWLALKRPVSYYFCSGDSCRPPNGGDYEEIFATGNPFVWWTSLLAMLFIAYRWIRRRNLMSPEGLILGGFVFTLVPWLLSDALTHRPAVFLFYLLPTVPFMCLGLAYVATVIGRSWEARSAIAMFAVGTVGVFAFYWPLLAGKPLPVEQWDARIWVFDNCDKPVGDPIQSTVIETLEGAAQTRVVETTADTSSLPPTGWCWI